MEKKLIIISRNLVSTDFWSTLITPANTSILKWNKTDYDIHNVLPDVVVVDDYFSISDDNKWMREVVNFTGNCKSQPVILCLSPVFAPSNSPDVLLSTFTERYTFDQQFVDRLNLALAQSNSSDFNLSA
jgi:hypothetical protein